MPITRTRSAALMLLLLLVECSMQNGRAPGAGAPADETGGSGAARGGSAGAASGTAAAAGTPSRASGGSSSGGTNGSGGRSTTGTSAGGVVGTMVGTGGSAGAFSSAGAGTGGNDFGFASTSVPTNGAFAVANTCVGADTSPDLEWGPGVSQAQSYAVVLEDAATSVPQWIVWDIPATVTALPAAIPPAAMIANPAGAKQVSTNGNGYVGPCPSGQLRFYVFSVYALPVPTLAGVTTDSPPSAVATAINLTPPVDVAVFGASAGMNSAGAAGYGGNGGLGGMGGASVNGGIGGVNSSNP